MVTLITRVDRAPVYTFESDRVIAQGDPTPILTAPLWVSGTSAVTLKEQSATALVTSATVSNTSDETQYLDVFVDRARPRRAVRELVAQDGDNTLRIRTTDFAPGYRLPFSIYDFQSRPLIKFSVGPSDTVPDQRMVIARTSAFSSFYSDVLVLGHGRDQGLSVFLYDEINHRWGEIAVPFTIDDPHFVFSHEDDPNFSWFTVFARESSDDSMTVYNIQVGKVDRSVVLLQNVNFPGEILPTDIAQAPFIPSMFVGVSNQGWHHVNTFPFGSQPPRIGTGIPFPDSPNAFSLAWQSNYIAIHYNAGQGSSVAVYDVGSDPRGGFVRLPDPPFVGFALRGVGNTSVHFRPTTSQFFITLRPDVGVPPTSGTEYVVAFEIQGSTFTRLPEIPQTFAQRNIRGTFSPDGRYQVFVYDRAVFDTPELYRGITIWDWESGSPVDVTDELNPLPLIGDVVRANTISEDGRFLVIAHTRSQFKIQSAIDNMSLTVRNTQQQLLQNPSFEDVTGMEFDPALSRYIGYLPGWTHTGPPPYEQVIATVGEGSQLLIRPTDGIRWLSSREEWPRTFDNSDLELNPTLYLEQTIPGLTAGQVLDLEFDVSGDPGAVGAFVLEWNGVPIQDPNTGDSLVSGNESLGVLQGIPVPPRSTITLPFNKFMLRSGEILTVVSQTGQPLTVTCSYLIRVDEELELV